MKFFSKLNKPVNKAGNKQAGIVFLEYVIMAFIATVAVICAIWWLYWHLQQMTWEIKDRLKTLPRTCPLETPYGAAPESQPTPPGGEYVPGPPIASDPIAPTSYPEPNTLSSIYLTYPKQRVDFILLDPSPIAFSFSVWGEDGVPQSGFYDGTVSPQPPGTIIGTFYLNQTTPGDIYGPNYDVTFDINADAPGGTGYPSLTPPVYYVNISDWGP